MLLFPCPGKPISALNPIPHLLKKKKQKKPPFVTEHFKCIQMILFTFYIFEPLWLFLPTSSGLLQP